MDSLLQEINMLPSVLGCFVYSSEQQTANSKVPPIFKENNIKTIGSLLARIVQMGGVAGLNFTDIEIKYDESLIVITPLTKGALLVIICEPSANKSLISMTAGMLSKDIDATLTAGNAGAPVKKMTPVPSKQQPAAPQPSDATTGKEAEIDATLAPVLEQVKDALALAIGPIASPVMRDTIEIWAKQAPPSRATLPSLAKLLCEEIDDDDLEKEFLAELKKISN